MPRLILPSRRSFIAGSALGLLAAPAIVRAGNMMLLGAGKLPGGGASVVFDAVSNAATGSGVTTPSWTHTPVGVPTAVAVLTGSYFSGNDFTTATYGGISMSPSTLFGATPFAHIWFLANPPSGPQTVTLSGQSNAFYAMAAITVTGSDTTTCFRNTSGGTGTDSGAGSSLSISSDPRDLVIDCVSGFSGANPPSGSSGTSRYTVFFNGNLSLGVATSPGGATVNATWTVPDGGAGQSWAGAIASFKAA